MFETKTIEIRDEGTHIPAIAIYIDSENRQEDYPLRRAGYINGKYVILMKLIHSEVFFDPYNWEGRTMQTAHLELIRNWQNYKSGDVLDVQFVLGETTVKKESEKWSVS